MQTQKLDMLPRNIMLLLWQQTRPQQCRPLDRGVLHGHSCDFMICVYVCVLIWETEWERLCVFLCVCACRCMYVFECVWVCVCVQIWAFLWTADSEAWNWPSVSLPPKHFDVNKRWGQRLSSRLKTHSSYRGTCLPWFNVQIHRRVRWKAGFMRVCSGLSCALFVLLVGKLGHVLVS